LAQADIDKAAKKAKPPDQNPNQSAKPAAPRDDRSVVEGIPRSANGATRDDRPPTATGQPATGDKPSSVPADKLRSDAKQGASKVKPDGQ